MLEEGPGHERAERRDAAADRRPQRDRLRAAGARPQRGDQGERGRVRHPGRDAAEHPGAEQHARRRRVRRQQARRHGQHHAGDQQQLAAVAVPDGAEVEHRRGQARASSRRRSGRARSARRRTPGRCPAARRWRPTRFRFATPATRISASRTSPARSGACARGPPGGLVSGLAMRCLPNPSTGAGAATSSRGDEPAGGCRRPISPGVKSRAG